MADQKDAEALGPSDVLVSEIAPAPFAGTSEANGVRSIVVNDSRLLWSKNNGSIQEPESGFSPQPLNGVKSELNAHSIKGALLAHYKLVKERLAIGHIEAKSQLVKDMAQEALELTARLCASLGREVCVNVCPVPFSEMEILVYQEMARRAGYHGKGLLRWIPNDISWRDLKKLPVDIRFPDLMLRQHEFYPQLPTNAPFDDDLGVLDGYWCLHMPRAFFPSLKKSEPEQLVVMRQLAEYLEIEPTFFAIGDATDLMFALASAVYAGDVHDTHDQAVRTYTAVGSEGHACIDFNQTSLEFTLYADDMRAPYLGIAPMLL